jgi:predicted phage tail protein
VNTENSTNRKINELKLKVDNFKQKMTHDMENLRKRNKTKAQNTMEGHSSRIEQAEDRISELKDKMDI